MVALTGDGEVVPLRGSASLGAPVWYQQLTRDRECRAGNVIYENASQMRPLRWETKISDRSARPRNYQ